MIHKMFIILIVGVMFFAFDIRSFAGLIDWEVRNRYLKEQQEAAQKSSDSPQISQDLPRWMQVEPAVKTDEEKKFDFNKDGVFQPVETKVYLRRTYQDVQTGGIKNISNSEVLKEYDANKDGVISKLEADKIKKDAF